MSDSTLLMTLAAALVLSAGLIATLRSFATRKRAGRVRSLNLDSRSMESRSE